MLRLCRGLIAVRISYLLPVVAVAMPQWESLELLYCVAIRLTLVISYICRFTVTLVEVGEVPLRFHAIERALQCLEQLHRTPSIGRLRQSLLARPNS